MMKGLCAILRRQPVTERTADTQALLDSYGNAASFIDFDTLAPIEAWLKKKDESGLIIPPNQGLWQLPPRA